MDLPVTQITAMDPSGEAIPNRSLLYGATDDVSDLLQSSLLLVHGEDLAVLPSDGDSERVEVEPEGYRGQLFSVGAARLIRWKSLDGVTYLLSGRGVGEDELLAAARSVSTEDDGSPAIADRPEGFELQFESAYVTNAEPLTVVPVGSTVRYGGADDATVTITAAAGTTALFATAVLATGADRISDVAGSQGVIGPSLGIGSGTAAVWWAGDDVVAVTTKGSGAPPIELLVKNARGLSRAEFDELDVDDLESSNRGEVIFSGETSVGGWAYTYLGQGDFRVQFTDSSGNQLAGGLSSFAPELERPAIGGLQIEGIGDDQDFVTGIIDRSVTGVRLELSDGETVSAEVKDVDPELPYLVFGAIVPDGSLQRAVALDDSEEVGSQPA
jgi:hypothetical protein